MNVSLKDVAKAAGKSPGTVSQVLNNRRANIRISEDTRRRILETADRLGYRPNPIARSLRTRNTQTIGVIINAFGPNPQQFDVVEKVASEKGYQLLTSVSRDDAGREEHAIQQLIRRQIDGLLLISPAIRAGHRHTLEQLVYDRFPLIGIGPLPVPKGPFVDWDRASAYQEIGEHLLSQGCQNIAFLGTSMSPGVRGRIAGLEAACEKHHQATLQIVGCEDRTESLDSTSLANLLRPALEAGEFDAVVAQTDHLALAVIQVARDAGRSVPNDLAVTGCSDTEFGRMIDVPLTTIRLPDALLAQQAMNYLIDRMTRPEAAPSSQHSTVPAEVLIRQSSSFCPPKSSPA